MDKLSDELYHVMDSARLKELMSMRKSSRKFRDILDKSFVWCDRLRRDFNIEGKGDCFNLYKRLYKEKRDVMAIQHYNIFKIITPTMAKLNKDVIMNEMYLRDHNINANISLTAYSLHPVIKSMNEWQIWNGWFMPENYFDLDQLVLISRGMWGQHAAKHNITMSSIEGLIYRYIDLQKRNNSHTVNSAWALLHGLLAYKHDIKEIETVITDKVLNNFVMAWDGNLEQNKQEKIKYVLEKQEIFAKELYEKVNDIDMKNSIWRWFYH